MGPNVAEKFIPGGTNFREVQIKRGRPFIEFIMMHMFALVSAYTCADLCDMCKALTSTVLAAFFFLLQWSAWASTSSVVMVQAGPSPTNNSKYIPEGG